MQNISLFQKKQLLFQKAISDDKNSSLFKYFDNLLINRRFQIAKELTHIEQILTIDVYNLQAKEIINIINNFINNNDVNSNLFDIIKVSNLPDKKIINSIPKDILLSLVEKLDDVSRETYLIGIDFSILRAVDNFILKIKDSSLISKYQKIRKNILIKILSFDYSAQKDELESVYMCWIDRTLNSVMQHEFDICDFIKIYNKFLKIIPEDLNLYWKMVQNINYLCFQQEFDDCVDLRKFKRFILKQIKEKFENKDIDQSDFIKVLINTLAEPTINKEKFYYLFDMIKKLAENSKKDKLFCFDVIDYLIYINKKQGFFNHRFIREYFFNMVCDLFESENDLEIKEKEFYLFLKLFNLHNFFYYNKKEIIYRIGMLLSEINKSLLGSKFYKYIDVADYIFANNKDVATTDFIEKISKNSINSNKIYNRFNLYLS